MQIVAKVTAAMQVVFGRTLDALARTTGCVQRQRKFSGMSLMRTLVLTLLQHPAAKDRDYRAMAANLGVQVTEGAITHRFTDSLVRFLEEVLKRVVAQTLAARPVPGALLRKFTDVRIGDSTTIMLPDELAKQFPGCGGTGKACHMTWKEVVVLYRARWQIELLFKLWKSHNRLAQREMDASPQRQMAVLYAKLIGVIVQHWILLTATWSDGQRSLRKAAAIVRDWIVLFSEVLDDRRRLCGLLRRVGGALAETARVSRRKKHPSLFQLLENPELLEYIVA